MMRGQNTVQKGQWQILAMTRVGTHLANEQQHIQTGVEHSWKRAKRQTQAITMEWTTARIRVKMSSGISRWYQVLKGKKIPFPAHPFPSQKTARKRRGRGEPRQRDGTLYPPKNGIGGYRQ